jgi:hypothetical protein
VKWQTGRNGVKAERFTPCRNDHVVLRRAAGKYPGFEFRKIGANVEVWTGVAPRYSNPLQLTPELIAEAVAPQAAQPLHLPPAESLPIKINDSPGLARTPLNSSREAAFESTICALSPRG